MDGCSARTMLGVSPSASLADIKTAYRTLVKHAHPDRGGDAETFDRIARAYEFLIAEASRPSTARTERLPVAPQPTRSVFRRPMWTRVAAAAVTGAPRAAEPASSPSGPATTFAEHLRRASASPAAA
jgi:curved DNA-binding protein CbpA